MRSTRTRAVTAILALAGAAALASAQASGIGVGNLPPTGPFISDDGEVVIGSPSSPVPIWPDPTAPFWNKQLELIPIDDQNPVIENGDMFFLVEHLLWLPNPRGFTLTITDWDEQIDTPGWGWAEVISIGGLPEGVDVDAQNFGTFLRFEFDPIDLDGFDNGLHITINKKLTYTGQTPITGPAIVNITEFFTPAPGTLAALAGLGAIASRRRRA